MLRYKTETRRPGLVALYDIRPGNGAGLFLQPQSLPAAIAKEHQVDYKTGANITLDGQINQQWATS